MKKFQSLIGVLFLFVVFCISPFSAEGAAQAGEMPTFNYNIVMPTGSMGGSFYTIGAAMSELFTSKMKGVVVSSAAANTSDNIAAIINKEAILALAQASDYFFLYEELPKESEEISSIGVISQSVSVIVVRENSNYYKIDDLVGKKISLGAAGSGQYLFNKALLEAAGYSEKDFQCEYMSAGSASEAFAEGKLEAVFGWHGVPASNISQMAATTKCRILQLDQALLDTFFEKNPYYVRCSVNPAAVPDMGVLEPYQAPSLYGELLVHSDTDEEFVYWLTKTLYDNYDALVAAAPNANVCTPENSVNYATFKLHPGAQRYYRENNYLQ